MKDIKPVTHQVYANTDEGFIRLTTDEVRDNWIDILRLVLVEKKRIVLQRAGEEVAAIIPTRKFEQLDDLMANSNPASTLLKKRNRQQWSRWQELGLWF